MADGSPPRKDKAAPDDDLSRIVGDKAARKLRARQSKYKSIWFGLSVFGLIGWSVALPGIIGAWLGYLLDEYFPREQSWTLALLLAGITLGCFNAWRWLEIERRKIAAKEDDDA